MASGLDDTREEIYIMDNKPESLPIKGEVYKSLTDNQKNALKELNIVSDDELRERIINGTLVDPKLETTLFPNGKPSK